MYYVILVIIGYLSWFFGVLSFCQIIGSIRTRQNGFLATILIWLALIGIVSVLVHSFLSNYFIGYLVAMSLSFIKVLFLDKIE